MNDHLSENVRLASSADVEAIVELCAENYSETAPTLGNGRLPFSREKVTALVERSLIRGNSLTVCGVIGTPKKLEASILLQEGEAVWYSSKPILKEVFAIVAPAYRKTSHARSLAAWSKIAAACVDQVLIAEVTAQRIEAKERFYARSYGAERFGAFYAFDPTPGA